MGRFIEYSTCEECGFVGIHELKTVNLLGELTTTNEFGILCWDCWQKHADKNDL